MRSLVFNAGSSFLKFELTDRIAVAPARRIAVGSFARRHSSTMRSSPHSPASWSLHRSISRPRSRSSKRCGGAWASSVRLPATATSEQVFWLRVPLVVAALSLSRQSGAPMRTIDPERALPSDGL